MTNPASVSDLEARFWRPLTDREQQIAQIKLDDAYDMLLDRRPNLEVDVAAGNVKTSIVVRVLCSMVGRVFSNPEGKNQEAIDDYSYRRDPVVATGEMHVTPTELADITPGRQGNRSVRLVAYGQYTPVQS